MLQYNINIWGRALCFFCGWGLCIGYRQCVERTAKILCVYNISDSHLLGI